VNQEQSIIKRVLIAQHNIEAADSLIRDYFPFIKSETAKTIGRIPVEGKDDELSIALMGFHEAIESYDQGKGPFLKFAALVVHRRIVDYLRQENRFKNNISFEGTIVDTEKNSEEQLTIEENITIKESLKWEILHLTKDLERFGISLSDVASNCPKHDKTISSCREILNYIINEPDIMESLFDTGKLPIQRILKETTVRKKTLEKYRKYLIALTVIYFQNYDCMKEHLTEVFKFEKGGKCR